MTVPRVLLRSRHAKPFFARHPWVFAGAIADVQGNPADGGVVDLYSSAGIFIARGLYNSHSQIRVRLYSWSPDLPLDRSFWHSRLTAALQLRRDILHCTGPGQACRLVFSEGDGLSGLTVDRYDRWLVLQFTALGLAQRCQELAEILAEMLNPEGIYLRTERGMSELEGIDLNDGLLWGTVPAEPIRIDENGLSFLVDLTQGQKTGFYTDQRDNRHRVAQFAPGRRVLDAFCYTGGFGLYTARAGATEVIGVDVSEPALTLARQNAAANGLTNATYVRSDVFTHLGHLVQQQERFGLVILDPPKFARKRNAVEEALRAYRRLQTLAIRLLEPGGILVMCCCSGLIDAGTLEALLGQLAETEKREVQILEKRGQAADHPVSASCLESSYLKCLICRVG
jgi:23S rRNA (cytosine1962-C5)-methyltransferase